MPTRFLKGLLPEPLLKEYTFWQSPDNTIVGYQRPEVLDKSKTPSVLRIQLLRDSYGMGAKVVRVPLKDLTGGKTYTTQQLWEAEKKISPDTNDQLTLLNLLYTPEGTLLDELNTLLCEDISHVLIWSKTEALSLGSQATVDLVELPRLQLSFYSKQDLSGAPQLYSSEYLEEVFLGSLYLICWDVH